MGHYQISSPLPQTHFLSIRWVTKIEKSSKTMLHVPLWRPGRYEMQNFPKNIRDFEVKDQEGQKRNVKKVGRGSWEVDSEGTEMLEVTYQYYAIQYDAGGVYADALVMYATPGNCFVYHEKALQEPQTLEIMVPAHFSIACSLTQNAQGIYEAEDYHELADSPFLASPTLQSISLPFKNRKLILWFQGEFNFSSQSEIISRDFVAFAQIQCDIFGDFPVKSDYHFIYIMHPYSFHHGVEHKENTVIALGPDVDFSRRAFYREFLGISCHELFHLWNVKRIRPRAMWPYHYQQENFSTLGWVYEGITTYFGDLLCYESGSYTEEEWYLVLSGHLKKHLYNPGRYHYSVAESSWDTWLDGYTKGIPARKVSIYTEGFWAACILDYLIQNKFERKRSIKDFMRRLYEETSLKQTGYDESLISNLLYTEFEIDADSFFRIYIHGKGEIENLLPEVFEFFDWQLSLSFPHEYFHQTGFLESNSQIQEIWPGSPAETYGLDVSYQIQTIENLENEVIVIQKNSSGQEKEIRIPKLSEGLFFPEIRIQKKED